MGIKEKVFYEFGSFRMDAAEQRLWRGGDEILLTPKAFSLLLALVERSGQTLLKEDLMEAVWPDAVVEENNLADNVSLLRQTLGDDAREPRYIKTVPRRGYRFVAEVTEVPGRGVDLMVAEHTRERIVIDEETSEEMDSAAPTATLPAKRGKRLAFLALALVGVVGATPVALMYSGGSLGRRPAVAAPPGITVTTVTNSGVDGASTISPDGKFIAYAQNYSVGTGCLYVQQVGTSSGVQLLPPGERIFGTISFSPDSAHIYYITFDKHDPKGALYKLPVLGGPPERLLSLHGLMFGLSPDGTRVAFFRDGPETNRRRLVVAALDGGTERTLLSRSSREMTLSFCPAWSPDATTIAFAASDAPEPRRGKLGIYTVQVTNGEVKRLSKGEWAEVGKIVWAADGRSLIFVGQVLRSARQLYYLGYPGGDARLITSGLQNYGNYGLGVTADGRELVADAYIRSSHIWAAGADGDAGRAVRLTTGDDDGGVGLTTLADGRIVYVTRVGGARDIWVMNGDGTGAHPLTADRYTESEVTATPNGRYLVFVSDREGFSHIYRMDVDGSDLKRLTSAETNDGAPDCSPDGEWVVYTSSDEEGATIRKVSIDGGAPIDLIEGAVAPAFSPDGKLVSCIFPAESVVGAGRLAIIPASGGQPVRSFDVVSFAWSYPSARWTPNGQSIVYRRMEPKKGGLWNLWQQPVEGGETRPLTNFKTESVFRYAFTRDGQRLVLSCGNLNANVALITGFQ